MKWTIWGIIFYIQSALIMLSSILGSPDPLGITLEQMAQYATIENGYVLVSIAYFISGTLLIGFGGIIKQMKKEG